MKKSMRIALPILIVLVGVAITFALVKYKPTASRSQQPKSLTVVEVIKVSQVTAPAIVRSTGEVTASQEVTLIPQVSGKIIFRSERLVPGGRFQKGELIARIQPLDYDLAVQQAKSAVRQAELDLELEQSRQQTVQREWELLGDNRPESEAALALRKPHLVAAQSKLIAAQSSLEQALLNLSRTEIRAPFHCVVVDESIDVGQVVGSTSPVATLIGTDRFWIQASVSVDKLGLMDVPGFNAETGSTVTILHDVGGGSRIIRTGEVVHLGGKLDSQTRTALLLIALENPLDPPEGESPLLNGAYVDLEIHGRQIPNTFLVPRSALVGGQTLWLVTDDNKLTSSQVRIAWGDSDSISVTGGINAGDRIVNTPLSLPIEGMKVQVISEDPNDEGVHKEANDAT